MEKSCGAHGTSVHQMLGEGPSADAPGAGQQYVAWLAQNDPTDGLAVTGRTHELSETAY